MLRLALSKPTTDTNATAELVDLSMGRFVYLTTATSDGTAVHWRAPVDELTEFLDRADSEMPVLKVE